MRAKREPHATIPDEWASPIALTIHHAVPFIANHEAASAAPGRYLFRVGKDSVPVTIVVDADGIEAVEDVVGTPDVTLHMTPDQYIRLVWGRLDVRREAAAGEIRVEGDVDRAAQLNSIFRGD